MAAFIYLGFLAAGEEIEQPFGTLQITFVSILLTTLQVTTTCVSYLAAASVLTNVLLSAE